MNDKPQFHQLLPILFVKNLESEVLFYRDFGFKISYQGKEFPDFIGLKHGSIEFGLQKKADFDSKKANENLAWQMDTENFRSVIDICKAKNLPYSEPRQYYPEEDGWEMTITTPNGYIVHLEKTGKE